MSETAATNNPRQKRRVSIGGIFQLAFGCAALVLVFLKTDPRAVADALRTTRAIFLPAAVVATFAVTWLMACRWGLIVAVRGNAPSVSRLFGYYLIGGFFTNFIPGGGVSGDVARLIYVDRDVRDKAFIVSTLVYERLVGVFVLLLIGLAATMTQKATIASSRTINILEVMLAAGFVLSTALMSRRVSSRVAGVILRLGEFLGMRRLASGAARTLGSVLDMRLRLGMLAATIMLSLAIRVVWTLGCYVVVLAMGLPLSLLTVFWFMSIVDLVRLLPISVGGLGVREWVLVALFSGVGLSAEKALTFSILAFAPIYLNALVGGLLYISRARVLKTELSPAE